MKAKLVSILESASGGAGPNQYLRGIPGNGEYVAICSKPELRKATRKRKAKTSNALAFKHLMEVSQAILRNPERRAAWEAQYEESKRKAYKYGKPIQGRLCDYVRHHVSEALKSGEEIIP